VRAVPPSLILRRDVEITAWRPRRSWLTLIPVLAGLSVLAVWQAGSLTVGGIFLGAATAALALLTAIARGLVRLAPALASRLRRSRLPVPLSGFAWRQGLASLHRPGGHAPGVIVALGVGVMLLVATALLEATLTRQIDHERRREAPSFFFVDVQPDQRDAFERIVHAASGGVAPALTPVIRARLAAVDGRPVTREMIDRRRAEGTDRIWYLTRDYLLTFATTPPPANTITRGRWWTAAEAAARPLISVEEDAAHYLGVDVGGRLAFDVQGVRIEAEVLSLRKVDWQTLSTNFFVIFSPGALDGAPLTYVATARVPASTEAAVQDAVVAALPNVIAVPVRDILERVATVLEHIAVAIRVIALFSIGAGLIVMAGALAASRYQRLHESMILRTLGATRQAVARAFAVEYACLGIAAGLGGSLLAALLTWIVLRFVLEIPWSPEPATLALGVVVTTAVAMAVGFGATFRLLGKKPLPVLRQE
jgi:putative ABC transport system permease protein